MRLYAEEQEEAFRARALLKQWKDDGHLSEEQYRSLRDETPCDLKTTNIFLRLVLLLFTGFGVAAVVGLFFVLFLTRPSETTAGIWFLIFSGLSYAAAETVAKGNNFYRHGVEEAFAISAVALVCLGIGSLSIGNTGHSERTAIALIAVAGVASSLWIWYRFGLWYAFPAAMVFAVFLPGSWHVSQTAQRCFICVLYAGGLACIAAFRSRHRSEYLDHAYSLAEALLWMGIYLVFNLKLTAIHEPAQLWSTARQVMALPTAFYWTTWVLTLCLPPVILVRGVREKDRAVIVAGMITAVLSLIRTNRIWDGNGTHGTRCYLVSS